jgi:hypothetical protein
MFSAGAAAPGRASAVVLLAGPVLACAALVAVLRARSLARRLDGHGALAVRPPLEDLGRLVRLPVPPLDARRLLVVTTGATYWIAIGASVAAQPGSVASRKSTACRWKAAGAARAVLSRASAVS